MEPKSVLCLLNDGFEEIEVVAPVDLLRRAEIHVVIAAMVGKTATGRGGIRLEADAMLADLDLSKFDLLMIPGGPAVGDMRSDGRAAKLARDFTHAGKPVAAICAAPLILMDAGLLVGKQFTAYQSVREELGGGLDERVVIDGDLITSCGPGTAVDFGLAIIGHLCGAAAADRVADEIMA
jgi:4-methyl-5(b-hydroxyethyl)-thiazole monophosphate biosynthesis